MSKVKWYITLVLASMVVFCGAASAAELYVDEDSQVCPRIDIMELHPSNPAQVQESYGELPMVFEENRGQSDSHAKFISRGSGYSLFLTPNEMVLVLSKSSAQSKDVGKTDAVPTIAPDDGAGGTERAVLRMQFVGANTNPHIEPFNRLETRISYFTGDDPAEWHQDVPAWGGVRYVDIYPGIDLEIVGQSGRLAPRLVVQDDYSTGAYGYSLLQNVRLRVEGVSNLTLDDDHLRLTTALGDFALPLLTVEGAVSDAQPAVHNVENRTFEVSAPFASAPASADSRVILSGGVSMPHTSDLSYSTYLGGSGSDMGYDIAVDSAGNVYITGETSSTNFPTTPSAYDTSYNGGTNDVFVTKLSADGSTLLYSTYLGGSSHDGSTEIVVDNAGNAYITGASWSTNFPTTENALDRTLNGGRDAFVAKLNADGDGLLYSTYIGGNSWDYGQCLAIDSAGNAYVGGFTHGDFPTTPGTFQTTFGGLGDGYVAKLNADGSALIYSTYIGGNSWENVAGIAVDNAGNAYTTSGTHSTNFPTTPGAWDETCDNCRTNGKTKGYVAKLNADGSGLIYGTYLGSNKTPGGGGFSGIVIDRAGNAYIVGDTTISGFPTTDNALQPDFGGGSRDAVVTKLNADGSDLIYSTYLGGSGAERGHDITIDGDGNAYVTGYTASTDFPTADPLQAENGGGYDAFVAKLNDDGSTLLHSTYLGGSGYESVHNPPHDDAGIALDDTGNIYLMGVTASTDFPTTDNALQPTFGGGSCDVFVTKMMPLSEPKTKVVIPSYMVGQGESATVPVTIENATDAISGVTLTLRFDPAVVNVTGFEQSDFPGSFAINTFFTADGWAKVVADVGANPPLTGDRIVIANVTMDAVGDPGASCSLGLEVESLLNDDFQPIPYTPVNGTFATSAKGDVNNDGSVNFDDVIYLAGYLAGWPGFTTSPELADVTGDGIVNVGDVTYLARYLAGWLGYVI
jgi:hypothetical protein